jgi:CDP-glucose 4,6-dehydratase
MILVTGASGAFGAHYAKRALDAGVEVVSIRHDDAPFDTSSLIGIRDKITWAKGDICDGAFVKRVVADYGVESIIHFAALPLVQVATRTTVPIFQTNFLGTVNLLEAVKENAWAGKIVRFVFVSTDKVYGDAGPRAYTEDMPLNGLAIYDSSKAAADLVCRTYARAGLVPALAVVRPCNIIAPGDMNLGRVLPRTIVPAMRSERPILYKTLYRREFMAVQDACQAIEMLDLYLRDKPDTAHGQAFNIGSGEQRTLEEAVDEVLQFFPDVRPKWIEAPAISRIEIPFQLLDTTKMHQLTNWKAKKDFGLIVSELVQWWKSNWERIPESVRSWRATGWH